MTEEQKQKAQALARCTFLPGSYNKRFARAMAALAGLDDEKQTPLTEKQSANLDRLFHMHRKQIGARDHTRYCNCKEADEKRRQLLEFVASQPAHWIGEKEEE